MRGDWIGQSLTAAGRVLDFESADRRADEHELDLVLSTHGRVRYCGDAMFGGDRYVRRYVAFTSLKGKGRRCLRYVLWAW